MHLEEPPFSDRRSRTEDAILLHIKELQGATKELKAQMTDHHAIFEERVEKAVEKVFDRSFPGGDPDGHRKVHEGWIERADTQAAMWRDVKGHLVKSGVVAALCWLGYLVWLGILKGPKP